MTSAMGGCRSAGTQRPRTSNPIPAQHLSVPQPRLARRGWPPRPLSHPCPVTRVDNQIDSTAPHATGHRGAKRSAQDDQPSCRMGVRAQWQTTAFRKLRRAQQRHAQAYQWTAASETVVCLLTVQPDLESGPWQPWPAVVPADGTRSTGGVQHTQQSAVKKTNPPSRPRLFSGPAARVAKEGTWPSQRTTTTVCTRAQGKYALASLRLGPGSWWA